MPITRMLRQPFPAYQPSWKTLRQTGYAGGCVFIILFLLRPFGLESFSAGSLFWNAFAFGMVTFILASFNAMMLPWLFPKLYEDKRWIVGKEMVMMSWQIITITAGNLLLAHYLYGLTLSFLHAFNFFFITVAVGIFPIGIIILVKQKLLLKKYVTEAGTLDLVLVNTPSKKPDGRDHSPKDITFYSENGKEHFTVASVAILYIASADNYIRIFYVADGNPVSYLLRSSLRRAEETLTGLPGFFRCHRTCLVNLSLVTHVSGNAQGYKLHLTGTEDVIPVSRNLNAEMKSRLMAIHAVSS